MKKILKFLLIFIISIFLILLLVPVLFKGTIKEIIKEQADSSLNAKLDFSDLSISMFRSFPTLSVRIEGLSLKGINEFEKDTLVSFNYFQTDVYLGSVIFGDQIEIKAIVLDKPKVNAIVLEDGKANWDIVKPDTAAVAETGTTEEPSKFKISLKKFVINQAKIVYSDRQSNMDASIDSLDFLLKGDMSESKTNLNINTTIAQLSFAMDGVKYLRKAKLSFKSDFEADMDSSSYTFKENELGLNDIALGFSGNVKMPADDIVMKIDFKTKKTTFKSVLSLIPEIYMTDFAGIETSGTFDFKGYVDGIYNDSILPAFGIDLNIQKGMFKYPDLPKSVNNINIAVKVDNKGGSGNYSTIDLKNAHAEMAGNPIDARAYVSTTPGDVDMSAVVKGKIDLESIKDIVPLENTTIKGKVIADLDMAGKLSSIEKGEYDKFKANGAISMIGFMYKGSEVPETVQIPEALIKFTPAWASLDKFDVLIGKSDMHLVGKIDNILPYVLQDSTLVARFYLNSNNLDAADLMSDSESIEETAPTDTSALTAFEIPGNIDFLLKSDLKKIKYDNLNITNLKGDIILKDSKAMFNGVNMNLLDGSMGMDGSYDAKNIQEPKVDFDLKIKDFNIPAAFEAFNTVKQLAPIAKNANGKFSLDFNFDSKMDYHLNPKYETLNGAGRFQSKDISVKKSESLQKLADLTKWKKLENLSLKDIDLKFKIENGNLQVDPTKLKLGQSEMVFGGSQNLNKDIKYEIGLNIPRKELGEAINNLTENLIAKTGKDIALAENIKMDIMVVGKLNDPKFKLKGSKDEGGEGIIKQEIKKNLSEQAKKLIDKADKKAQALIDKAKLESDKIKAEAKKAGDNLLKEADKQGENIKAEADKKGKQLIEEADKKAQEVIDKASNPVSKLAAKKTADLIRKEAKEAADKLNTEADKSAKKLHDEAQIKSDKLNSEANEKADGLVQKAEKEAADIKESANKKAENM
jgi:vacuolar-type H+-ATPase subunit H